MILLSLAISLSALMFAIAGVGLSSFLLQLFRGEVESLFDGPPLKGWVTIVILAANLICIPLLFKLWRGRHSVREIASGGLRVSSLLLKGLPANKRIWFLVLFISWVAGFALGFIPPY